VVGYNLCMDSVERREVVFEGRVQGVGLRATAARIARDHGLTGWVRNEPDGRVRAEYQGPPGEIDAAIEALRAVMGGPGTNVLEGEITGVESRAVETRPTESRFEVRG
jgi:acylphosphatase